MKIFEGMTRTHWLNLLSKVAVLILFIVLAIFLSPFFWVLVGFSIVWDFVKPLVESYYEHKRGEK